MRGLTIIREALLPGPEPQQLAIYHELAGSTVSGDARPLLTTWVTFVPNFLFTLLGALVHLAGAGVCWVMLQLALAP